MKQPGVEGSATHDFDQAARNEYENVNFFKKPPNSYSSKACTAMTKPHKTKRGKNQNSPASHALTEATEQAHFERGSQDKVIEDLRLKFKTLSDAAEAIGQQHHRVIRQLAVRLRDARLIDGRHTHFRQWITTDMEEAQGRMIKAMTIQCEFARPMLRGYGLETYDRMLRSKDQVLALCLDLPLTSEEHQHLAAPTKELQKCMEAIIRGQGNLTPTRKEGIVAINGTLFGAMFMAGVQWIGFSPLTAVQNLLRALGHLAASDQYLLLLYTGYTMCYGLALLVWLF